ncbi:MAG: LD-carboxypeptidase [Nitrosomonas sp.]|nr:LD-carboxypeptidase [Nitrosomonas sp.]
MAFSDNNVKDIICFIGGFNSNQLLPYINWDVIKKNPKVFLGYSDITVLRNAILSRTGLITNLGPAYSTFGQEIGFDLTSEYFKKCLVQDKEFALETAPKWSDDRWYLDQKRRTFFKNEGPRIIQKGITNGELIGENLSSL